MATKTPQPQGRKTSGHTTTHRPTSSDAAARQTSAGTAARTAGRKSSHKKHSARYRRRRKLRRIRRAIIGFSFLLLFLVLFTVVRLVFLSHPYRKVTDNERALASSSDTSDGALTSEEALPDSGISKDTALPKGKAPEEETALEEDDALEALPVQPDEPPLSFAPHAVTGTAPSNYIATTSVNVDDVTLSSVSEYQPLDAISFDTGKKYTDVEGIVTFRGNNFRSDPAYGVAEMTDYKLETVWSQTTGSLAYNGAYWTGSGWTGQPLMEKWSQEVKQGMTSMYDWAKQKEDLVEVIYACMDGYVYFLDLETGEKTRDDLYLGFTFKGSGALDPRGYPILYVGAGYDSNNGTARVFIVNLLDCTTMYTFGNLDPFSLRGSLSYFDSSPLVDAESDTLIYPGENGILYRIKLNTSYDAAAGSLSIAPSPIVKWNYYGVRSSAYSYWLGMEDSAAMYGEYLYVTDNGGNLMCLNINTMELVWAQDTLDDSNSTPVLSVEDGRLYLYVSTSFRLGWRSSYTATVPVWKVDAETGEIIWQKDYTCYTEDGVSGGVQSTIALGQNDLSDYIYVTVARTGAAYDGVLACINKKTGEVVWEHTAYYAWSSPVCVYNSDGSGKVIYASCAGKLYLLDGRSGETLDTLSISDGAVEASPAVYNNRLVIGTRDCHIYGIELK